LAKGDEGGFHDIEIFMIDKISTNPSLPREGNKRRAYFKVYPQKYLKKRERRC